LILNDIVTDYGKHSLSECTLCNQIIEINEEHISLSLLSEKQLDDGTSEVSECVELAVYHKKCSPFLDPKQIGLAEQYLSR